MSALPMLRAMLLAALASGAPLALPGPIMRHSIGTPRSGRLTRPAQLRSGPGYRVHDPAASFGTPTMVGHLQTVLANLHRAYPAVELRVGDLSRREGGKMQAHSSHQSGRDVDLGLVPPPGTVRFRGRFERAPAERIGLMDPSATLFLVRQLAATASEPGGVQWIIMDYGLQERLHAQGVAEGLDAGELDALFQYPHGRSAEHGLVRHFPRHRNHMHVRFACGPDDPSCRTGRASPPRVGGSRSPV